MTEAAHAVEAHAIEAALRQANGFERRAADLLGIAYTSLRRLTHGGRHAHLADLAAELRAASGYRGGNPALKTTDTPKE